MMSLTMRMYRGEEDYWRIRAFLREVLVCNAGRQRSWDVARFDYWRWHGIANLWIVDLRERVCIWETGDGRIAAVLNPESEGDAFFQIHPGLREPGLEAGMLDAAEQRLAGLRGDNGLRRLTVWANEHEKGLNTALEQRGYAPGDFPEYQRRRSMDLPIPDGPSPQGYTLRSLGDGLELLERCYASGVAFHPGEIEIAIDNRKDVTWYRNIQNAPLYRRDLDVVAIAPDGAVASFCTVWFDDVNRTGIFEPVATMPDHQRRGLGKAVMYEGLRRLKRKGATMAYVGSYSAEAGALYGSVGFTDYELCVPWSREF